MPVLPASSSTGSGFWAGAAGAEARGGGWAERWNSALLCGLEALPRKAWTSSWVLRETGAGRGAGTGLGTRLGGGAATGRGTERATIEPRGAKALDDMATRLLGPRRALRAQRSRSGSTLSESRRFAYNRTVWSPR